MNDEKKPPSGRKALRAGEIKLKIWWTDRTIEQYRTRAEVVLETNCSDDVDLLSFACVRLMIEIAERFDVIFGTTTNEERIELEKRGSGFQRGLESLVERAKQYREYWGRPPKV